MRPGLRRLIEALKIVVFAILAAVTYGVAHDLVTAHVCVEYFTVAHPPIFPTEDPTLLAFGWGIIATWWVGLVLGVLLAAAALLGPRPVGLRDIRRLVIRLMVSSFVIAMSSGLVGLVLARDGSYPLTAHWNEVLEPDRHAPFAFDAWAHLASYVSGMIGGLVVIATVILRRRSSANPSLPKASL